MNVTASLGLDSLHYALVTQDDSGGYAVGTVYQLEAAKTLSYNVAASLVSNFWDDGVGEVYESTGEKGITLTLGGILPEHEARITGRQYVNGEIVENKTDSSPYIAIMGRTKLGNGAYGYFTYFKALFGKPNSEDATREATPTPRTVTFEGRIADTTFNGVSKSKLRSDDTSIPATRITNYFNGPVFPTAALGALTVTAAAGTAGQIVFTFTKAGGNTVLNQGTFIDPNVVVFITATGVKSTPTSWTFGTSGGATQTATAVGLPAGASTWYVSAGIKDSNGIGTTPKGGSVTVS